MSDVGDNLIASWCGELAEMEALIEALQKSKKDFYGTVRDKHGKKLAASLKLAMKLSRMDSEKLIEAEEIDTEAQRILGIIERAARAPRATRTREAAEEINRNASNSGAHSAKTAPGEITPAHDAETGEIIDQDYSSDIAPEAVEIMRAKAAPIIEAEEFTPASGAPADAAEESPASAATPSLPPHAALSAPDQLAGDHAGQPIQPETANQVAEPATAAGQGVGNADVLPAVSNVTSIRKNWKQSDPAHRDCLDPAQCGGFSNLGLCQRCKAEAGQTSGSAVA